MHYLSVENLGKSYGVKPLFTGISFHVSQGDKVAFVARNGTGKSSLLKILAGGDVPDEGTVWVHKDVRVALLEQDPRFLEDRSVADNVFMYPHPTLELIREYEKVSASEHPDQGVLTGLISRMDEAGAWQFEARVKEILSRLGIAGLDQPAMQLSGGQRKRIAVARTLIDVGFDSSPTLLLMDEPTNHLDVEMIEWLEQYLDREKMTLLLVTHDRYFLDRVCTGILELEDGNLYTHKGDYAHYLEKKFEREQSEKASVEKARNLLRKELDWMRRQPRARTTKSKSRIDAFYDLKQKAAVRDTGGELTLNVKMTRLGGKILELKKVYKSFGDKRILHGFDYTFKKGERVGVIGANGAGKSTFLNVIQQIEKPDSGKVNIGDTVTFGYYSQMGLPVDEDMRMIEWVKRIAEFFPLADGAKVSASEFLTRFLFPPEQQYTFISKLSGGEKRRLHLLSILFANPNFLILDEPTNDLDIQTLQILEDFLESFPGCVMIVSHDRYFMDRLVDHLFVFEGDARIRDFPGNYSQYRASVAEEERQLKAFQPAPAAAPAQETPGGASPAPGTEKKKLSYSEKRELEQLDRDIPRLTEEKRTLEEELSRGGTDFGRIQAVSVRIGEIAAELDEKELRWLDLDERRG
jgi:ATP-binding cassette subfamily F protein uup